MMLALLACCGSLVKKKYTLLYEYLNERSVETDAEKFRPVSVSKGGGFSFKLNVSCDVPPRRKDEARSSREGQNQYGAA